MGQRVSTGAGDIRRWARSIAVRAWAAHLVLVFAASAVTVWLTPERGVRRPAGSGLGKYLVDPLSIWDGAWYLDIAALGYGDVDPRAASFWPRYPTLISLLHQLTGLSHATAGILISSGTLLAALMTLYSLVRNDYGEALASRAVWIVAISPLSFFFSAVYSEALFLALTVGALALARSRQWTLAALVAGFAAITRNGGLLVFIPLGIMLVGQYGWNPRRWWTRAVQLAAAAAMPIAFAVHLDRVFGDPLMMSHTRTSWGRSLNLPWDTLLTAYHRAWDRYWQGRGSCGLPLSWRAIGECRSGMQVTVDAFSDDLSILAVTGFIALLPFGLRYLLMRDSLYLVAGFIFPLALPATEDPLQSVARYVIVLFPAYIVVAKLVGGRWFYRLALVGGAGLQFGLTSLFAQGYFVA
jgi:hypothetical protein